MTKIYLDAGHGGNDSGATGNGLKEKDITLEVTLKVRDRLKEHGFEVVTSRTTDINPGDAGQRGAAIGNSKADYGLSIHVNAGGGTGAEIIVPAKETVGKVEYYLQQAFSEIGKFRKICSRCYNTKNFYNRSVNSKTFKMSTLNITDYYGICREAWKKNVSADIIELFFIDTKADVDNYLKQKDAYVEAIVKGICLGFNVTYKAKVEVPTPEPSSEMYRVRKTWSDESSQKGAYSVLDNAINECDKHQGYSVYDSKGEAVYPIQSTLKEFAHGSYEAYVVTTDDLNIRRTRNASSEQRGTIPKGARIKVEYILGVDNQHTTPYWGSVYTNYGNGFINLSYTKPTE